MVALPVVTPSATPARRGRARSPQWNPRNRMRLTGGYARADLLPSSPLGRQFLAGYLGFGHGHTLFEQKLALGLARTKAALGVAGKAHALLEMLSESAGSGCPDSGS
jgi:hypothetical protein